MTALDAIAPENPATNDVQPVRKAAARPNAASRYTYSPPASGRITASSAYAMAPAKASAPPAIQVARNSHGFGTFDAMPGEKNRMPPPMTLEMMIAAASKGPSRRASVVGAAGVTRGDYKSLNR